MRKEILKRIYYAVRPLIPLGVRWYLQRKVARVIDGFSTQPTWPIPEKIVAKESTENEDERSFPFLITHDVDTLFGFENIRAVLDVEMRLGFKGSWNIVPHSYGLDQGVLVYLREAGNEIGVHDWNHDGRLFSDRALFDERIEKINRVFDDWDAKGFRAGMVFHNDIWMQALECEYDSSYYDTDPYQPMGGGCRRINPFMLGNLVELPYTMPQDHVLFVAEAGLKVPGEWERKEERGKRNWEWIRRYLARNPQITQIDADYLASRPVKQLRRRFHKAGKGAKAQREKQVSHGAHRGHREFKNAGYFLIKGVDIWKMKAEWLVEQGGMVLMITHPDYLCHPKLRRAAKRRGQSAKRKGVYDGWLRGDDRDVQEVRERGIVEEKWHGSLLEQYAAFLNWFKREFEGRYWHCLPGELVRRFKESQRSADFAD